MKSVMHGQSKMVNSIVQPLVCAVITLWTTKGDLAWLWKSVRIHQKLMKMHYSDTFSIWHLAKLRCLYLVFMWNSMVRIGDIASPWHDKVADFNGWLIGTSFSRPMSDANTHFFTKYTYKVFLWALAGPHSSNEDLCSTDKSVNINCYICVWNWLYRHQRRHWQIFSQH